LAAKKYVGCCLRPLSNSSCCIPAKLGIPAESKQCGSRGLTLPFVDMCWTFKAFVYLVTYRLLDWLNPGYLRRYEQKQKRERGIDYWMRPSAVA
jgi:hypothetical protein